jgi:phosphatidylglycerol:prolipoprotein diacylglycerol transferase
MDPIMLQLGPLALRWYGVLIATGVVLGALWTLRLAKARGLDGEWLLDTAPWLVAAGVVGARAVYVLTSPSAYFGPQGDPIRALFVWEGGLSIHGAVLFILPVLLWRARLKGFDGWAYLDIASPVVAFGIIGGRIGNFMNGTDTGGRLTNWPIAFHWPEPLTPTWGAFGRFVFGDELWRYAPPACASLPAGEACMVHLTPFYGMLVGVALLGILAWLYRRPRPSGTVFLHVVLWYSLLRSLIEEPFRDNPLWPQLYVDPVAGVGVLTLTQVASIALMLLAWWGIAERTRSSSKP